jgi:hypothetical protein
MDTFALLGSAAGLGLLAGIRLYFTVFALGLAIRFGWFQPDPASHLSLLAQTPVLVTAGGMFLAEFVADKIPWFDSIWDAVHTFIRPLGAAALGITALGTMDPTATVLVGLLSGGAALTGHTSKAATRAAINHSPEPFSNWLVSLTEDLIAPVGLWLVMAHPVIAAALVIAFFIAFILAARLIFRLFRSVFARVRRAPA